MLFFKKTLPKQKIHGKGAVSAAKNSRSQTAPAGLGLNDTVVILRYI